jgi:hypothetical protein
VYFDVDTLILPVNAKCWTDPYKRLGILSGRGGHSVAKLNIGTSGCTDLKHTQAAMISRRFPAGPAPFRPGNDREKKFSAISTTTLKAMLCALPWS